MLRDQELARMDAEALRQYINVLHEALSLHGRANVAAMQIVDRSRLMSRQVNRMGSANPMQELARALAGGGR